MKEDDISNQVLIPLLGKMGFLEPRFKGGTSEFGKDLICYTVDQFKEKEYVAIQLKKEKITQRNIHKIKNQIIEAFIPFQDAISSEKIRISKFYLITIEHITSNAQKIIDEFITEQKWNIYYRDGTWLINQIDENYPAYFSPEFNYFDKYFKAMKSDFETIKDISAVGQKQPIPLEELYVPLRLSEKRKNRTMVNEEGIELISKKDYYVDVEEYLETDINVSSEYILKNYKKVIILGNPGSGKTTLLKYFALRCCKENIEQREKSQVPIYIVLHEFLESGKKLREYIDDVLTNYHFPQDQNFIENILEKGKCIILLDGFDELVSKDNQENIAKKINKFLEKYPKNQIIVTSRFTGYQYELEGFNRFKILNFNDEQIREFVKNWFREKEHEKAKAMIRAIMKNERIRSLAKTPLLISIIAIIYEEDKELPQRRVELYERCIQVLLRRWDVQKRLRNLYESEKKEFILRKLAFYCHSNNKRTMTKSEIKKVMRKYFSQIQLKRVDEEPFLKEIWQRTHIIQQNTSNNYDFLILFFQEYFASLELKETENIINFILEHLFEPWWEEPILLYAGLKKDATFLINEINKKIREDIFYNKLLFLGKCISNAYFTDPEIKKRIINKLLKIYETTDYTLTKKRIINALILNKSNRILKFLMNKLIEEKWIVQRLIAKALGDAANEEIIEQLLEIFTSTENSEVRWGVTLALEQIKSEKTIDPLIEILLSSENYESRKNAARILGRIGNERALTPLIQVLNSEDEYSLRFNVVKALGEIGTEKALVSLIETLNSEENDVIQRIVVESIGKIGSEKAFRPLLQTLISTENYEIRIEIRDVLGKISGEEALEPLLELVLTSKDPEIQFIAAEALINLEKEDIIKPAMEAFKNSKSPNIQWSTAFLLAGYGVNEVSKSLINALLTSKSPFVRQLAALSLGRLKNEDIIEQLIEAYNSEKTSEIRFSIALALGSFRKKVTIKPLIKVLKEEKDAKIRICAMKALEWAGMKEGIDPLIETLTNAKEPRVRSAAARVLGKIGDDKAINALTKASQEVAEGEKVCVMTRVNDAAYEALEKVCKRIKRRILI
ncbi:MAG: HEAT repeat domain-containing protein [Candidatus Helarchaeota archaeon]|nr:HEAT repeat domain-containing protein [Candidatus Helarchaeota archaeon]